MIALVSRSDLYFSTEFDDASSSASSAKPSALLDLLAESDDEDDHVSPYSPAPTETTATTAHNFDDKTNHIDNAITHFRSALTYDDEHLPSRTWVGRCYWRQERYDLARAELERATKGGRIYGRYVWLAWYDFGL